MKAAVLISIQPKWCELIASGRKTIEVRKCYIYATKKKKQDEYGTLIFYKDNNGICEENGERFSPLETGKVIGEFVCDSIYPFHYELSKGFYEPREFLWGSCLSLEQLKNYIGGSLGYAWNISDLVIYDEPKNLSEFKPWNRTEDDCKYSHLGLAIPKCSDCHECYVKRPFQSWGYVEERNGE